MGPRSFKTHTHAERYDIRALHGGRRRAERSKASATLPHIPYLVLCRILVNMITGLPYQWK